MAIVDKGYRGVQVQRGQVVRSGQRQGATRTTMIKRRSAIELTIE